MRTDGVQRRTWQLAALLFVTGAAVLPGQGAASLTLKPRGASSSIGWYAPQRIELSSAPRAPAGKLPPRLATPMYGTLRFGTPGSPGASAFQVIVDEPPGKAATLYVDTNGNGDLTDDAATEWKPYTSADKLTSWNGGAWVTLGSGQEATKVWLGMYRFDPKDPSRQAYKLTLFYYRDYAYEGSISLGSTTYRVTLSDETASGDFRGKAIDASSADASSGVSLLVDLNGNGTYQTPAEALDVRKPFNIGGTTYEIAGMTDRGSAFRIVPSARKVPQTLPPPDLAVGSVFPPFDATDMDGKPVRFPGDFRGKVVMLDFWATWCGPCMEEVPGLVQAYRDLSTRGFEVLGITLDSAGQEKQVRSVTGDKGMTWRQIYDGGGWKARLAVRYLIQAIPAGFLVDGDSGLILASEDSLRGAALRATVDRALKAKPGR